MRIAMWSGPRNLSTALMYAFAARGDCAVWDEPFYASYLVRTGLDHPMRDEIVAAGETDAEKVARLCVGGPTGGMAHQYQKHMAQHVLPGQDTAWMSGLLHAFLIRHPARVVASFASKREQPGYEELGFDQLSRLFEVATGMGQTPPVIDSDDLRRDPAGTLKRLCSSLNLAFRDEMLQWPAGGHANDGVWARHWYGSVHASTGFAAPDDRPLPELTGAHLDLVNRAMPEYRRMLGEARRQAGKAG